ncbi:MAG: hypothetical protein JWM73_1321 [Solirubrobacterales bacterium]|nr:hypothetical protein [Solirubrobacterales bacterium]
MDSHPAYDSLHDVVRSVQAPEALRARIDAERDRTLVRRMVVKRMKLTGAMAAVAATLGIVVGLASLGGGSDPSPLAAAALATRGPVPGAGAPAVDRANPRRLAAAVDGVSFPVWSDRVPWKATGQRTDELDGRHTQTVYYDDPGGVRLGYTIVAGDALPWPDGSRRVTRHGVEVRVTRRDGRILAFWREHGHTCVISAPDSVPEARMVDLASADYLS